jgi:hypothetical protein
MIDDGGEGLDWPSPFPALAANAKANIHSGAASTRHRAPVARFQAGRCRSRAELKNAQGKALLPAKPDNPQFETAPLNRTCCAGGISGITQRQFFDNRGNHCAWYSRPVIHTPQTGKAPNLLANVVAYW